MHESCRKSALYVCLWCEVFRMHVSCHIRSFYVYLCYSVQNMCKLPSKIIVCMFVLHIVENACKLPHNAIVCMFVPVIIRMNIGCYTRSFPNNSAHLVSPDKTLPAPSSGFQNVVIVLSTGHDVKSPCRC
jgi:hypothetical protein